MFEFVDSFDPIKLVTFLLAIVLGITGKVDWWIVILIILPTFSFQIRLK
jgi:hypothetical protein